MLKEAIQHVQEHEVAQSFAHFEPDPSDPRRTALFCPGGNVEYIENQYDRRDELCSLESVARHIDAYLDADTVVYLSRETVSVVISAAWKGVYNMAPSEEWAWLVRASGVAIDPGDFRRILRYELAESAPSDLLEAVSRVNFAQQRETNRQMARAGESLGESITRSVAEHPDAPLPEEIQVFHPRLWSNGDLDFRPKLPAILDPDLERSAWRLFIAQYAQESAIQAGLIYLETRIKAALANLGRDPDTLPLFLYGKLETPANPVIRPLAGEATAPSRWII